MNERHDDHGKANGVTTRSLLKKAHKSGDAYIKGPYFAEAEGAMAWQQDLIINPILDRYAGKFDYATVLDFAAGHGRNSVWLIERSQHIVIVDINQSNLDYCRKRFAGDSRFSYVLTNGFDLAGIEEEAISFLYSFDSMVHFEPEVVESFIADFRRVLQPGGYGFCHHSNYSARPGGDFRKNPHARNYMTKELFAQYLSETGFEIIEQTVLDWEVPKLDCISVFRKPHAVV